MIFARLKGDTTRIQNRYDCYYKPNYYKNLLKTSNDSPFTVIHRYNDGNVSNLISYSLYGNNPKYYKYIDYNVNYIKDNLPGWVMRIYLHDKVDKEMRDNLIDKGIQVYIVHDDMVIPGNSAGAFWRFLPLIEDVNCVILDIDDPIPEYGGYINKFFNNRNPYKFRGSNDLLSVWHTDHVMAGTIYKKKELKIPINERTITHWPVRAEFGSDEIFLYYNVTKNIPDKYIQPIKKNFIKKIFQQYPVI